MLTSRNPYDKIGQLDNHIYNNRSSDEKVQAQYFSKRSLSPSIESVEGGTPVDKLRGAERLHILLPAKTLVCAFCIDETVIFEFL